MSISTKVKVSLLAGLIILAVTSSAVPPNPLDYDENGLHKVTGNPLPDFPEWYDQPGTLNQRLDGTGYAVAVLIEFPDHLRNASHPESNYEDLIFSDDTYPTGSVRDWYQVNSYGQYDLEGGVYGWYPTSDNYNYNYNDQNYGLSWGGRAVALKAAQLSDPIVDFGEYDNDGPDGIPNSGDDDGYVDLFFVFHAGPCGSQTSNVNDIWSHKSSIYYTTDDDCENGGKIHISDYAIQPEENPDESMVTIGVVCHEMGHVLGLPDLYDYSPATYGIGFWGAMSYGCHGGDGVHRYSPVHFSAWSKEQLGWVAPTEVAENLDDVTFEPVEENQVIYKVWRDGSYGQEYFLIENRQQLDFDQYLMGTGLLIWHIDNTYYTGCDIVDLEEADGNDDLDHRNNKGDDGDPYPGSSSAIEFSPTSYPNSDDNDGAPTNVIVDDFQIDGLNMVCDIDIGITGIEDGEPTAPVTFRLYPAVPNPSSGNTSIKFALPYSSEIVLNMFDVKGRKIATIAEGNYAAGEYEVSVSGLSRGVYLYALETGEFKSAMKLVVK
jgi:immune inhibitor A